MHSDSKVKEFHNQDQQTVWKLHIVKIKSFTIKCSFIWFLVWTTLIWYIFDLNVYQKFCPLSILELLKLSMTDVGRLATKLWVWQSCEHTDNNCQYYIDNEIVQYNISAAVYRHNVNNLYITICVPCSLSITHGPWI